MSATTTKKTAAKKAAAKKKSVRGQKSEADTPTAAARPEMVWLSAAELALDPENVRRTVDEERLEELADSIGEVGIQQPLKVLADGDGYQVVMGNRRLQAVRLLIERGEWNAAVQLVPCIPLTPAEAEMAKELQLVENLQREDVSPVDEALGYAWLKEHGREISVIARRIGKSRPYVYKRLRLVNAPESLLGALARGEVTVRVCELVGQVPQMEDREKLAEAVLNGPQYSDRPLNEDEVRRLVREEYMVSLKKAPWDHGDGELVSAAGSCADCAFRTGNMEDVELTSGRGGDRGSDPNVCTAPSCFRSKMGAHWERVSAAARAAGQAVLSAADGKRWFMSHSAGSELVWNAPYRLLDAPVDHDVIGHYDRNRTPSWADLLDGMNVGVVLAWDPFRERVCELVDRKEARAALLEKARGMAPEEVSEEEEAVEAMTEQLKDEAGGKVDWAVIREQLEEEERDVAGEASGKKPEWQVRKEELEAQRAQVEGLYAQIAERLMGEDVRLEILRETVRAWFLFQECEVWALEPTSAVCRVLGVPEDVYPEDEERTVEITDWVMTHGPDTAEGWQRVLCLAVLGEAMNAGGAGPLADVADLLGIEVPEMEMEMEADSSAE